MLGTHFTALAALAALLPTLAETLCGVDSPCPASAPCCSPYGYCGSDSTFCLGGCNPLYSHELTSCRPQPVCKSSTTDFTTDLGRVLTNGTYDGNATTWDWIVEKGKIEHDVGNGVRLILTKDDPVTMQGTLISSTRYVHYGEMDFVFKASKWPGVISAAITMSDVKDEIDWEWAGNETHQVQSNFFFLGHVNYSDSNGGNHEVPSLDTAENFHTYTINWQEDFLEWKIDGELVRHVKKDETLSPDGTRYEYPSTPSRVQMSIWAAGIESSSPGTVEWAGGMIDWEHEDYVNNGYFHNTLQSVRVKCKDETEHDETITGYEFAGNDTMNVPTVGFTNRTTTMNGAASRRVAATSGGILGLAAVAALGVPWMALMLF